MTPNAIHNIKQHIDNVLGLNIFSKLNSARRNFIANILLAFISIKGKINFMQLERFSSTCEQTYRIHFEKEFDFFAFNKHLTEKIISKEQIIAFDPCYIPKSGKKTFGRGKFWSGSDKCTKWGLEICGFAIIDVINKTAFHLKAWQTPGFSTKVDEHFNFLSFYASIIVENAAAFKEISDYFVADAFFSKKPFVDKVLEAAMHLISRLRDDSVLMYLYHGVQSGKKGRPKKFNGRIDVNEPDGSYFTKEIISEDLTIHTAVVYSKAFKREIKLAIAVFYDNGEEIARKLYFSTDLNLTGEKIVRYYQSRFQIEFLYRDAKQHSGLTDCQARSERKLDFHFNASLSAVNVAKVDWLKSKSDSEIPFSMANYKTLFHNSLLLDQFICRFGINPNSAKNKLIIKELRNWGIIDAFN